MCIKSKNKITCVPNIVLDGTTLKWISDTKYLGVLINEHLKDDDDLRRQMKSIYCKGNTLLRKFGKCSEAVKIQLFQSFCSNMYCAHLWNSYRRTSFKQVEVSYNNVFRYLLNVRERCSISQLFLTKRVDGFNMLRRKAIYGFLSRVNVSSNMLVKTLTNSMYFIYASDLNQRWQKVLYVLQRTCNMLIAMTCVFYWSYSCINVYTLYFSMDCNVNGSAIFTMYFAF